MKCCVMKYKKLNILIVLGIFCLAVLIGCGGDNTEEQPPPPPPDEPLSPPKITKHTLEKEKIIIEWEAVTGAVGYNVYRGDKPDASFALLGTSKTTTYEDTKEIKTGSVYYYLVSGYDSKGVNGKQTITPYEVKYEEGNLQVQPASYDFSDSLTNFDLTLKNIGKVKLHWDVTTADNWVASMSPKEGDLKTDATGNVRITITREGKAPGKYTGSVVFKTDTGQGDIKIPLAMEVSADPRISTTPDPKDGLRFDATVDPVTSVIKAPPPKDLTIKNVGTGTLEGTITGIPLWLSMSDSFKTGSEIQIRLAINTNGLQENKTYSVTLEINSNDKKNPKLGFPVTLYVPPRGQIPPKLSIPTADTYLVFRSGEISKKVTVRNTGEGKMFWHIDMTSSTGWLKVEPKQDETTPESPDTLTFTVDRTGLCETQKTTVTVDASDSSAGSQSIVIEVYVPEVIWDVAPDSLVFDPVIPGKNVAPKNVLIKNKGEEKIKWSVSSQDTWIDLKDKSGVLDPGKEFSLAVSVISGNQLKVGSNLGEFKLKAECSKQDKPVKMQVFYKGLITGTALDSRTRSIVRDIQITLDGKNPTIYPTGSFEISTDRPGTYTLEAKKKGYIPYISYSEVKENGESQPVSMWMRPIPEVTHFIADPARPFDQPKDICFSNDGSRAYVTDRSGVSVINAVSDTVINQIKLGKLPFGIIANPRTNEIYVTDAEDHKVFALDPESGKSTPIDVSSAGKYPIQLAISQDGKMLYVTCRDSASVVFIDTGLRQVKGSYFVGRAPYGIVLSSNGQTLYITDYDGDNVYMMEASNGNVFKVIKVSTKPQALAASKTHIYVANSYGDQVSVISQTTQELEENISMGNLLLLIDLVVLEDANGGDVIYVADQSDNTVGLIATMKPRFWEVMDKIPLKGESPEAMAIQPGQYKKIYVINSNSRNVSVLEFK